MPYMVGEILNLQHNISGIDKIAIKVQSITEEGEIIRAVLITEKHAILLQRGFFLDPDTNDYVVLSYGFTNN